VAALSIRRTRRGALDPQLLAAQVEPVLRLPNIERATQKSGLLMGTPSRGYSVKFTGEERA